MNDLARTGGRAYEPGDWYGVVGTRVVVALPPEEKARVAALWALVDEGAGFEETLDALIVDGLRALSGFVLVSTLDDQTRVVIRGAARVGFVADGESVELDGSGATTWVERTLHGVTSMLVELTDTPATATSHTIDQGLVRIARLSEGVVPTPTPTPTPEPEPEPEVAPELEALDDGSDLSFDSTLDESPDETPDELRPDPPVAEPTFEDSFDTATPSPVEPPGDEPDDGSDGGGLWSPTPVEPAEPVAYSSIALVPDLPADDPADDPDPDLDQDPDQDEALTETIPVTPDHDGRTQLSPFEDDEFALVRPGIPGQPPAPAVTSRPVARLLLSTGETIDVDRVVIFGRAPVAPRSSGSTEPVLVPVPSPNQEISATHVEVRPGSGADHGTAVATDLGSTNGTVVMQPGLDPDELQPGVSVQLIPGALIDLGDGITIQVTRP